MNESPDARIEALARSQYGAFSREQALLAGLSPQQIQRRVESGRWRAVARGVYVLAGWESSFRQRVMVARLHAGPGAFASHRCAALLRGADGIAWAAVELTVPRRLRAIPDRVIVHYSTDAAVYDWTLVHGIPTATVTRTIVDLASCTDILTLERLFEWGQRRGETSVEALEELIERLARKGKPGAKRARDLLAILVRDGERTASDAETLFFQILRSAGLSLPTRQRVVHRPDGRLAFVDFAYEDIDAVLEVLGYDWHGSRRSLTSDAERNNDITLVGKRLFEFTWDHITKDRGYVIRTVTALLRAENIEYRC